MKSDIRQSALYLEAENLVRRLRRPGSGQISDVAEPNVSPDEQTVVYAGAIVDILAGPVPTRICLTHLDSGATRVLTFGPNVDKTPKFSPDGLTVAFLSDRHRQGDFQLYLLDIKDGSVRPTPFVGGWVEYLQWSSDGKSILLGVAGHGADISGGQGAIASRKKPVETCAWIPTVETGDEVHRRRNIWIYDLAVDSVRAIRGNGANVWEAAWCGSDKIAAIVSQGSGESLWYTACLQMIEIESGEAHALYRPTQQLGCPAACPSGEILAVVEAWCSDRGIVSGDLKLIDPKTRRIITVDTKAVDITCIEWRSERNLLVAGHRGLSTVVGLYDVASQVFQIIWEGRDVSSGFRYITVSGLGPTGDCVFVAESFLRGPELALIRNGQYTLVKSFDLCPSQELQMIEKVEPVAWTAPDGLQIEGWLLRPPGQGPHPLIMQIHGGPVGIWHPMWLGRAFVHIIMLLRRGFAAFFPNPRGSSGRGQRFIEPVVGDMGGADTYDYLSGVDRLVKLGLADPARLSVAGVSYGGFMTSWLITQDSRFAAAVSVSPMTNYVTEHLLSNIPKFVSLFLNDTYTNTAGKYFERSPVMHAHKATTPTLNICGALDRCTPPEEAAQFHHALLENGVQSVLLTYPQDGHGVRQWPASIDCAARIVAWLEQHVSQRTEHESLDS